MFIGMVMCESYMVKEAVNVYTEGLYVGESVDLELERVL